MFSYGWPQLIAQWIEAVFHGLRCKTLLTSQVQPIIWVHGDILNVVVNHYEAMLLVIGWM